MLPNIQSRLAMGLASSVLCCLSSGNAFAVLGQVLKTPSPTATSLGVPSAKAQATVSETAPKAYSVTETLLETDTVLREFTNAEGVVFAVTWTGPVLPDLNGLLGQYFSTFKQEAERARAAGKRGSPFSLTSDGFVMNSTGRMRNFSGYAYATALVPTGVSIKDVLQ